MEENPSSEANDTTASPQIPRLFCKRKIHSRIRKCQLLAHILSNMKQIYDTEKIYEYIYLLQLDCHPVAVVILHVNKT